MSEVTNINQYFKTLASDIYVEWPYSQKACDFIEEKFKSKSPEFRSKVLAEIESIFLDARLTSSRFN